MVFFGRRHCRKEVERKAHIIFYTQAGEQRRRLLARGQQRLRHRVVQHARQPGPARVAGGRQAVQVQAQAARLKELSDALDTTAGQVQELDQALRMMTDSGSDLLLLNDGQDLDAVGLLPTLSLLYEQKALPHLVAVGIYANERLPLPQVRVGEVVRNSIFAREKSSRSSPSTPVTLIGSPRLPDR